MKAIYRLKKNYQYRYVYTHSQSVADKFFVVLFCKSKNQQSKVGFSVNKKFGHAVKRNRIRRQMKSAVSQFAPSITPFFNVVIVPRKSEDYAFADVVSSLNKLFVKAGLLQ